MSAKMAANGMAILKSKTALTTQPSHLCVDLDMLTFKNVNLRHCHSSHFLTDISASFWQLWLWKAYQAKSFYIVKPKAMCHIHKTSKHQCMCLGSVPNL